MREMGMDTGHQLFVLRQQVRDEKYYTENCDWYKIRFIRSNKVSRLPEQTQPHNCVEKETEDCIWTGLIKPFYHDLIPGQRISWQLDNVLDPVTEPSGPLDLPPGNRGGHGSPLRRAITARAWRADCCCTTVQGNDNHHYHHQYYYHYHRQVSQLKWTLVAGGTAGCSCSATWPRSSQDVD